MEIPSTLEELAMALGKLGSASSAAPNLGRRERLREEIGSPLPPYAWPKFEQHKADARTSLGDDDAFDRAWQEGRALSLDQAVALALQEAAAPR